MRVAWSDLARLSTARQLQQLMQLHLVLLLLLVQVGQQQVLARARAALLGGLVPGHQRLQLQGPQLAVMLCW
jgi:hypothetical protein